MASGSYCSPPEYHIWNRFVSSSQRTCGHITAAFSQGASGASTGRVPVRVQVLPSGLVACPIHECPRAWPVDRKSTRLNSSHVAISYAVFCLKKKKNKHK